ncbi:hypothetical protein HK405_016075 [Cladochytrium tenue]|nr:hypothetical protein HK405_016075 [Cladochytrium tenue]
MVDSFVQAHRALVQRELDCERDAQASFLAPLLLGGGGSATGATASSWAALQRRGTAVSDLVVGGLRTGLGGKTIVELDTASGSDLPPNRFRPGDVVLLMPHGGSAAAAVTARGRQQRTAGGVVRADAGLPSGVVARVRPAQVTVVLSSGGDGGGSGGDAEILESSAGRWRVVQMGNEVTYRRMKDSLDDLEAIASSRRGGVTSTSSIAATGEGEANGGTPAAGQKRRATPSHHSEVQDLISIMVEKASKPAFNDGPKIEDLKFFSNLNGSQHEAVRFALSARHVALIHGPPGTGKSHTIVELVRQLVLRDGERVLVCGPSNVSVDTLAERMASVGLNISRLGHPARVKQELLDHTLEIRSRSSDEGQLVKDVREDMDRTLAKIQKSKKKAERKELYGDLKELRKEVVLSTLSGCLSHALKGQLFDTVIIDESSQAIEAESWMAILKGKRVVLAGDNKQLPQFGAKISRMLEVQYRMNDTIMQFSSRRLYSNKLIADASVKDHLLSDLPGVKSTEDTTAPLLFFDTSGAGLLEEREDDGPAAGGTAASTLNPGEAHLVLEHVRTLLAAGVQPADVVVITPYSAQVRHIRLALQQTGDAASAAVEVGTVDAFQGSEREAVLLSLVRSNESREIGFLADDRRLNVAITRARRHLAIFGNAACLRSASGGSGFLKALMGYLEEEGEVRFVE